MAIVTTIRTGFYFWIVRTATVEIFTWEVLIDDVFDNLLDFLARREA